MIFERVARLGVNLIVGIWLARYLGPTDFGLFNFAIAITTVFLPLVNFGLQGILVKELFHFSNEKYKILGTSFVLKLVIGVLVFFGILLFYSSKSFESPEDFIVILVAISILFQPFLVLENWYESQVKAKRPAILKSIFFLISSIIKIVLIIEEKELSAFAFVYSLEAMLIAIALIVAYKMDKESIFNWRFDFKVLKSLTSKSWLLVLSSISAILYLKIDQVMLGTMTSDEELGYYSAAVKLSEAWYFIPLIISNALFPAILSAKLKSKKEYITRLQQLCDAYFGISLLLAVLVSLFATLIIGVLYGNQYSPSIVILQIHIWAGIFIFLRTVLSKWLIAEDKYKFSLISQLSGAVANVALNLFLIPKFGGIGAAIATVISYFVTSFLILGVFKDTNEIFRIFIKSFLLPFRFLSKT